MALRIRYLPLGKHNPPVQIGRRFTPKTLTDIERVILRHIETKNAGVVLNLFDFENICGYHGTGVEIATGTRVTWEVIAS